MHRTLYYRFLNELRTDAKIDQNDRFLVVFAGTTDKEVFSALGFTNAHFTNLEPTQLPGTQIIDAKNLPFPDESYDHVVAHAGLHHTSRPHQALCEMYRVARKSVIFFESQDSLAMRLAAALNLAGEYEVNRNLSAGGRGGGVDDKPIPNHVYRWTLREVEKLVRSLDPAHKPRIRARREWSIQEHVRRLLSRALPGGGDRQWPSRVGKLASDSFNTLAGSHGNSLAVQIEKTYELQPWIEQDGDGLKLTSDPSRARRRSGLASRLPI